MEITVSVLELLQTRPCHHDGTSQNIMDERRASAVIYLCGRPNHSAAAIDEAKCLGPLGGSPLAFIQVCKVFALGKICINPLDDGLAPKPLAHKPVDQLD